MTDAKADRSTLLTPSAERAIVAGMRMRERPGLAGLRWALSSLVLMWSGSALAQAPYPYGGQTPAATAPANSGQPAPGGSNLEAGGLRPPGELAQEEVAPSETQVELEKSDQEDSGRGLEFVWLNVEAGYQHLDIDAFSDDNIAPGADEAQDGMVFGGAAGVKLLYFTLGARFRFGSFDNYQMWSVLGEGGVHFPLGDFEPYANVGVGYASIGSFNTGTALDDGDVSIRGLDVRAAVGLDYYLSPAFSLGAQLSGDWLVLNRPAISGAVGGYEDEGSSNGFTFYTTAIAGLHF
jgi:hypothetical protein